MQQGLGQDVFITGGTGYVGRRLIPRLAGPGLATWFGLDRPNVESIGRRGRDVAGGNPHPRRAGARALSRRGLTQGRPRGNEWEKRCSEYSWHGT